MSQISDKSLNLKDYFLNSPSVTQRRWRKGVYLCREDSELASLHFLVSGKFRVFRTLNNGREMLYRIYLPGAIIGDIEVFTGNSSASCSVQCVEEAVTLALPTSVIRENPSKSGELFFALGRVIARKLHENSISEALNTIYPLETRLAHYFLTFADPELQAQNLGQLAGWMGCSYRHLTRSLAALRKQTAIYKSNLTDGERGNIGYVTGDLNVLKSIAEPMMHEERGRVLFELGS